jgi:hypothetical protein
MNITNTTPTLAYRAPGRRLRNIRDAVLRHIRRGPGTLNWDLRGTGSGVGEVGGEGGAICSSLEVRRRERGVGRWMGCCLGALPME